MKRPEEGGGRLAIVFNGSPLFTGGAGSGESEIRRWIIENDWLEAIVALPDQLFYNTGISTYFWIVTNRKRPSGGARSSSSTPASCSRRCARASARSARRSATTRSPRSPACTATFEDDERVKIFPNEAFGFLRITVERPLRLRWEVTDATLPAHRGVDGLGEADRARAPGARGPTRRRSTASRRPTGPRSPKRLGPLPKAIEKAVWDALAVRDPDAPVITDRKGNPSPTPTCATTRTSRSRGRSTASTRTRPSASPRRRTAPPSTHYLAAEVLPYVPDAWVDHAKTKIGYEIPLTRHFYMYVPPRPLAEIDAEIKALEAEIQRLLREVTE